MLDKKHLLKPLHTPKGHFNAVFSPLIQKQPKPPPVSLMCWRTLGCTGLDDSWKFSEQAFSPLDLKTENFGNK